MNSTLKQILSYGLPLTVVLVTVSSQVDATEVETSQTHPERVHRIVIDCDDDDAADCEREIRIETLGGDSHSVHGSDHEMIWVDSGGTGAHHFAFRTGGGDQGAFLGIQLTELTPELRSHFGVASDEGVMVAKVVDDSPAFRAGLAAGDIITAVDGESIGSANQLTHEIHSREEGDTVVLDLWRDGAPETLSAILDAYEPMMDSRRHVMIDCGEGKDCGGHLLGGARRRGSFDCPDGEECEIKVQCVGGECDCTVNGDPVDCEELHTGHSPGD